jgi:DNA processing protein
MKTVGVTKALWCVAGLGRQAIGRIVEKVDASVLLEQAPAAWCNEASLLLGAELKHRLSKLPPLGELLTRLESALVRNQQRCVHLGEADYPPRLAELPEAPPVLFLQGPGGVCSRRRLAIVGSRRPDREVMRPTHVLCHAVARLGVGIVSGLAEGIDQTAHGAAVEAGGETWAFVACGIDQLDAAQQLPAKAVIESGGSILSCFPPGVRTQPSYFARRNKLIAGSSDAVWLVRAASGGGGLLTAHAALALGRPVLVSPGDWWNPTAQATLRLLHQKEARLCLSAEDLLGAVGVQGALGVVASTEAPSALPDDPVAMRVLRALEGVPIDFDLLCSRLPGLRSAKVSSTLTQLQLSGWVLQKPGRRFERVAPLHERESFVDASG